MTKIATITPVTVLSGPERTLRVPLRWTYEHAGRVFDAITIRRLTVSEVAKVSEEISALAKTDPGASYRFPVYVDDAGASLPSEFLDGLLDDDMVAVEQAATDFFPARFRVRADASGSLSGDDTERTSDV